MHYFRNKPPIITTTILLSSILIGCDSSLISNQPENLDQSSKKLPSTKLFLDFSLPSSALDISISNISGITLNIEENYFLASDTEGNSWFRIISAIFEEGG